MEAMTQESKRFYGEDMSVSITTEHTTAKSHTAVGHMDDQGWTMLRKLSIQFYREDMSVSITKEHITAKSQTAVGHMDDQRWTMLRKLSVERKQ
jgi:hypothetical protein